MREGLENRIYKKNLNYVKWGIVWCFMAAIPSGTVATFQTFAGEAEPFATLAMLSLMMLPFMIASMQDYVSAVTAFVKVLISGKIREFFRTIVTKPARYFVAASIFGGPVALGCYTASIMLAGPVYSVAIAVTHPATTAFLSWVFLKEKISPRGWFGILLCIIGPVTLGWVAPTAEVYPYFAVGIILAVVTAFGWGAELTVCAAGMDFMDSDVAVTIRMLFSGTFSLILVPIAAVFSGITVGQSLGFYFSAFASGSFAWLVPCGIVCAIAYMFFYKGANMAGASRAAAINPLLAVTATILGIVIWGAELNWNFFVGLAILLVGGVLVIGRPADLFTLRDVKKAMKVKGGE